MLYAVVARIRSEQPSPDHLRSSFRAIMLQDRDSLQLPSFTLGSSILYYYFSPSTFYEMKSRKQYAESRLHLNILSPFLMPCSYNRPSSCDNMVFFWFLE